MFYLFVGLLFVIIYAYRNISQFFLLSRILELKDLCLDVLEPLSALGINNPNMYLSDKQRIVRDNIDINKVNKVIKKTPQINEIFNDFYYLAPNYGIECLENFDRIISTYYKLLSEFDIQSHILRKRLNPLDTILFIFKFPSLFIRYFGIKLPTFSSRIFNFLVYFIPLIATVYSEQIRVLIHSIFN